MYNCCRLLAVGELPTTTHMDGALHIFGPQKLVLLRELQSVALGDLDLSNGSDWIQPVC